MPRRTPQLPDRFIPVTLEDDRTVVVNLDTVAYVKRHEHGEDADHTHGPVPLVELMLISGSSVPVKDDGRWGL